MYRKESYATFLEFSPDALLVTDMQGNIFLANKKARDLFAYEEREILHKKIEDVIVDPFFLLEEDLFTGSPDESEKKQKTALRNSLAKRKDGSRFYIEINYNLIHFNGKSLVISALRDLTLRQPANENIPAEKKQLLLDAMDKLLEGIQIIDHDWRYVYVNDSLVKHGKYPREELIGYTMMEKYPGIEETPMFEILRKCMSDQQPRHITNEFIFPDRSTGYFELSIEPIPEGLFILSVEITERTRFKLDLMSKNRKLQIMNTELEQFVYIASHDLQEPLKTVSSCIRMLDLKMQGKETDEEILKYLSFIGSATERMQNLIKSLLEYSRIGKKTEVEPTDLKGLLNDVLSDMQTSIGESKCIFHIGMLPVVAVNAAEIRVVFQNLISNAIKFRNPDSVPHIRITAQDEIERWSFAVADNGIGIEKKYLDKIFAIFKRLHLRQDYEGTGIGLAHCKKIIQLHGGEIWAESIPGEGSTFHFTISKKLIV